MQKTSIEWAEYVWNPIKGMCKQGCPYCYARKIYKRFKLDPEPRVDTAELHRVLDFSSFGKHVPEGSRIFVCSTHELFGEWISGLTIDMVLLGIQNNPGHTFIVLTKNPGRAAKFAFPPNAWVGTSIESSDFMWRARALARIKARVRFISFEPLLGRIEVPSGIEKTVKWMVIGGLSGERSPENIRMRQEWAEEIALVAKGVGISVFEKDNLHFEEPLREFPE